MITLEETVVQGFNGSGECNTGLWSWGVKGSEPASY